MPHEYCTKQNMIDRFSEREIIQLTDTAIPGTGVINDTVLDAARSDAAALIDGYIQARYELPLANPPEILTIKSCDIARYYLFDDKATEQIVDRYNQAVKYLEQVSMGKISLALASDGTAPAASDSAEMVSDGRTFGRTNSKTFI